MRKTSALPGTSVTLEDTLAVYDSVQRTNYIVLDMVQVLSRDGFCFIAGGCLYGATVSSCNPFNKSAYGLAVLIHATCPHYVLISLYGSQSLFRGYKSSDCYLSTTLNLSPLHRNLIPLLLSHQSGEQRT